MRNIAVVMILVVEGIVSLQGCSTTRQDLFLEIKQLTDIECNDTCCMLTREWLTRSGNF